VILLTSPAWLEQPLLANEWLGMSAWLGKSGHFGVIGQQTILSAQAGYVMLGVFGLLWIALGIWWGRRAKSYDGFAVAGRNVGLALATATAVATWITSNTTMLAPQFALELGVWGALAYSTASFGLFAFAPMSGRIRKLMPHGYTAVEFVRCRYGRLGAIPFLIISLFYAVTWLISMAMAGGKLLNVLSGIPYEVGMTVVITVCVLYTLFGGMYAVIGTDFIQSIIILVGLVVVAVAVLVQIDIRDVHTTLESKRPMLLSILFPAALMALFNNMLFGFGVEPRFCDAGRGRPESLCVGRIAVATGSDHRRFLGIGRPGAGNWHQPTRHGRPVGRGNPVGHWRRDAGVRRRVLFARLQH
jgi:hypothetical protein